MLQSNNRNAPVLLITFKRPDNTEKLINILIENKINKIFIYNNGPRNEDDNLECSKTKRIIQTYSKKYNNIEVLYKEKNTGLKYNIPEAINWVFQTNDRAIILEDDCFPNQNFFSFCNELLEKYENDQRIGQISGSNFLNHKNFIYKTKQSYYFSNIVNCWGWATWKNRWEGFHDVEMKSWPKIKENKIIEKFFNNKKNSDYFIKMMENNYPNNIMWDRAWFLTSIIHKRLTIIPEKNLISNIGYDEKASGQNPNKWNSLKLENLEFPLTHPNEIKQNDDIDDFIIAQGFTNPPIKYRILNKLKKLFK